MLNSNVYKEQRVGILIDVQNMYYSAKNLYNSKVNFVEILNTALRGRKLIRAVAYTIKADVKDEKNFHEALEKIGFEVKTKDLLVFHGGHKKGDWDVGIAMDAVRAAEKVDVIVVVSGDGDFKEMYEYVRGKGCRIEVIAFGKTASSSIKGYVDDFIDMDKDKKYLIPLGGKQPPANKQQNTAKTPFVNKPNVNVQKSHVNASKTNTNTNKPNVNVQKSHVNASKTNTNTNRPNVNVQRPYVNVSKPYVTINKPFVNTNIPFVNKQSTQEEREFSLQEINAQQPENKPITPTPTTQKKATSTKTPTKKKVEGKKEESKKKQPFIKKMLSKVRK